MSNTCREKWKRAGNDCTVVVLKSLSFSFKNREIKIREKYIFLLYAKSALGYDTVRTLTIRSRFLKSEFYFSLIFVLVFECNSLHFNVYIFIRRGGVKRANHFLLSFEWWNKV